MPIILLELTCLRCDHRWNPRKPIVAVCPKCKSKVWFKPVEDRKDNLTGNVYGRLTVLAPEPVEKGNARSKCQCQCGKITIVQNANLKTGHTKSCGCFHSEQARSRVFSHGLSKTPIYRVWDAMVQRCVNPNDSAYANYGGRGITVCERWRNSFRNFLEDMGDRADGYEIDRINNNGNYEPGNCRWVTRVENSRNTRLTNIVEYGGEKMPLITLSERLGIPYIIMWGVFYRQGRDLEKTLNRFRKRGDYRIPDSPEQLAELIARKKEKPGRL